MSRCRAFVAIASLCLALVMPSVASGQVVLCHFTLGFQTLHDLIPSQVGHCVDNESHDPTSGDAIQHTMSVGLGIMVWRKADNWTAFSDGFHTWVNGPNGLQERLNTERFPWEHTQPPALSDAAYRQQAAAIVQGLQASITAVIPLLQQPNVGDPGWTGQVTSLLSVWHSSNQKLQQLVPPADLASTHTALTGAMAQFDAAGTDLATGIQQNDGTQVSKGLTELQNAIGALNGMSGTPSSQSSPPPGVTAAPTPPPVSPATAQFIQDIFAPNSNGVQVCCKQVFQLSNFTPGAELWLCFGGSSSVFACPNAVDLGVRVDQGGNLNFTSSFGGDSTMTTQFCFSDAQPPNGRQACVTVPPNPA